MSGTIRGRVECYFGQRPYSGGYGTYRETTQEVFTSIYKTFKVHPNMTEIARHGGFGGGAADVNYWDEPNPFRNNAWFVFRMNTLTENPLYLGPRTYPWYVLVQWNRDDQAVFGSAPGNPGKCEDNTNSSGGNTRVAIQFAIGIGGDQNPWNGSGTLGENVKGTPVWKTPEGGSAALVYPRSNNVGGAHVTNRENMSHIAYRDGNNATFSATMHIITDDDNLVILWDQYYTETWALTYFGLFVPRPYLTFDYPMVMINTITNPLPIIRNQVYGSIDGRGYGTSNPCNGGGIPGPDPAVNGVKGLLIDRYQTFFDSLSPYVLGLPNKYFSIPVLDDFPIPLAMWEAPNWYGYAGQIDFIREVAGAEARCRTTGNGTRLVVGGSTAIPNVVKLSVPWPPNVNPGIGLTREGLVF